MSAQTKLFRNIGIITTLIGLPLTYVLVAPYDKMGLNAGAVGLAVKMVAFTIIAVNVQLYFIAKNLRFNFWRYLGHQVIVVVVFIVLAMFADFIVSSLFNAHGKIIVFLAAGFLYSVTSIIAVHFFPVIIGTCREDINEFMGKLWHKFI